MGIKVIKIKVKYGFFWHIIGEPKKKKNATEHVNFMTSILHVNDSKLFPFPRMSVSSAQSTVEQALSEERIYACIILQLSL